MLSSLQSFLVWQNTIVHLLPPEPWTEMRSDIEDGLLEFEDDVLNKQVAACMHFDLRRGKPYRVLQ